MIGKLVGDRYRIEREIGSGGMGTVWVARDEKSGAAVAVKTLLESCVDNEQVIRRFEREFSTLARISHPGVIRVHDHGRSDDGTHYIVMDLLECPSLARIIGEHRQLDPVTVARIGLRLARTLAHCHEHGVIHRDLKPANVLIKGKNEPVLIDFGLVREFKGTNLTATGQIIGTPLYMTPEQLTGRKVDGRCDLFQLGVLLYESLTGRHPFQGSTVEEVVRSIVQVRYPSLDELRPGLSPGWRELICGLLVSKPEKRFSSAQEVATRLETLVGPSSSDREPKVGRGGKTDPVVPTTRSSTMSRKVHRSSFSLGVVLGMFILGVLTGWFLTQFSVGEREGRSGEGIVVSELQARPIVGGFRVSWTTDRPQVSRVHVMAPLDFVVQPTADLRYTDHDVVVQGLPGGLRTSYRLGFDDGRWSLVHAVETGMLEASLIGIVEDRQREAALRLDVVASRSCVARIVHADGHVIDYTLRRVGDTLFELPLRVLPSRGGSVQVFVETVEGGQGGFDLGELVRQRVQRLVERVDDDPGRLVNSIMDTLDGAGESRPRVRDYPRMMRRKVVNSGRHDAYEELGALSPLVFRLGLVEDGERLAVYRGIVSHLLLALWSPFIFGDRIFDATPVPPMGELDMSVSPTIRADRTLSLLEQGDGRLRMTAKPDATSSHVSTWRGFVDVEDPAQYAAAELEATVSLMGPVHVELLVGDAPAPLIIYDRTIVERDTASYLRPSDGPVGVDISGALADIASVNTLYQRIPVSWLKPGRNELVFRASTISTRGSTWTRFSFLSLSLMLQERDLETHSP